MQTARVRAWRWGVGVLALLVAAACGSVTPPPVVQPPATMHVHVHVRTPANAGVAGARVQLQTTATGWAEGTSGADGYVMLTVPASLRATHLVVSATDWQGVDRHEDVQADTTVIATLQPMRRARRGVVRLEGRGLVDDDGPFLGVGASLFWGVWGYQHDRPRLERALDDLGSRGVDYVRVLAVVGPKNWQDRTVDPRAEDWDAAIAGLTDLAYARYGLRVQWSIFGGVDTTPTPADRRAVVERVRTALQGREQKVLLYEVANEGWNIGWEDPAEAAALARLLGERTPNLVAVTADNCASTWYADSGATIRTIHLDRSQGGEGGLWRPVRQPWEMQWCADPAPWTDNEGIGPGSSVASDDDPLRLVMRAATTWLSGGAAYVYHARAGIRGGGVEDMARGGPADWADVAHVEETLAGLRTLRQLLPADLPNWTRTNANPNFPGRPFDIEDREQALRVYCATRGSDVVCLPLQIHGTLRLVARRAIAGAWFDPLTGAQLGTFDVPAGGRVEIGGREAVVLKGRWQSPAAE